ncbi:MAG: sigma-70 family RNA polymerase sigma factor [Bacteroidota bacterium]
MRFFKQRKDVDHIIAGCRKGDARCQELLFKKYASLLLTVCRRYEYAGFGASDILQESFLTIFENIHRFDPEKGHLEAWMRKITVNTALKAIRKRKISFLDIERSHFQFADSSSEEIDVELISEEEILSTLQTLPKGYRTIFNLFVIEEMSHQEIASALGITVSTSKSQLSKAKKMLRKKLSVKKTEARENNRSIYTKNYL